MKRRFILTMALLVFMLAACAAPGDDARLSEENETTESTEEIIETAASSEAIAEEESFVPEPSYFDEYGVKYVLVEGTTDEYRIDEEYQEVVETPESSAVSVISYWPYTQELRVQFRNSGAWYTYYDVAPEIWYAFKTADSKGGYFNEYIKGQYECTKD